MKNMKKLFAGLLSITIILSGCTSNNPSKSSDVMYEIPQAKEEIIPQHDDIDFKDMKYERPDIDGIYAKIKDTIDKAKQSEQQDSVLSQYDQILKALQNYDQMQVIASIHNHLDLTDTYYEEENQLLDNEFVKLDNRMNEMTKIIMESEYKDAFVKKMGQAFIDRYEVNRKLNSPEIEALSEKETKLINQYNKRSAANDYTTIKDGKTVTIDDLDLSSFADIPAYYEIYEKRNKELGGIYQELVKTRVEIAKKLGYENYSDYAYEVLKRDYSKEDAAKFEEKVLKYIAPLYQKLNSEYSDKIHAIHDGQVDVAGGMPYLEKALQSEFPKAMQDAFAYMKQHGLYVYDDQKNMLHAGYTTIIGNEPFMFINTSDYKDPGTMFHEFGHYYNFFLMGDTIWNDSNNLDLAEVHSQGLETLMYAYYEDIYGEKAELMEISNLMNMLSSILQGACEDEFQQEVFKKPDMSLEEMNQLHAELYKKYMGYPVEYEWVDIHHHFETPFYCISYATSAASALEIWMMSMHDREDALQAYRNITQYTLNTQYLEPLKASGLSNPFDSDLIMNIADQFTKQFL
ncbi:peptidase M3 [Absiella sp. AM29-15]|uniref:peptidase M3 n=1 Tax=Absiella sp. AM29-15 TaxID=2292278 RepID=UPI000E415CBE|nr:peptidase M3 [Absiella sp. AM29-15]RGC52550.1 peptidase M3 [Absiella sp. AM29-15]